MNVENILEYYSKINNKSLKDIKEEYKLFMNTIDYEEEYCIEYYKNSKIDGKSSVKHMIARFTLFNKLYTQSEINYVNKELNFFNQYSDLVKYLITGLKETKISEKEDYTEELDHETVKFIAKMSYFTENIYFEINRLIDKRSINYINNNNLFVRGNIGEDFVILETTTPRVPRLLVDKSLSEAKDILGYFSSYKIKDVLDKTNITNGDISHNVGVAEIYKAPKTITLIHLDSNGNNIERVVDLGFNHYSFHKDTHYYLISGNHVLVQDGEKHDNESYIFLSPISLKLEIGDVVMVYTACGPKYIRIDKLFLKYKEDIIHHKEVISKAKRDFKYETLSYII